MSATETEVVDRPSDTRAPQADGVMRYVVMFAAWVTNIERWLLEDKRSLYGLSLARICSGGAVLGILATNFGYRSITYGPGSRWVEPLQEGIQFPEPRLFAGLGERGFTLAYLGVNLLAVLFILGWRTRLVGPLMLIGWIGIVETNSFLGDQGDNVLRIGLILLMFMASAEHWSLDSHRRSFSDPEEIPWREPRAAVGAVWRNLVNSQPVVPLWISNLLHNVALAALAFQLIIIYISAGMFKTQGPLWQHGTALYYPLQLPQYEPFPFLTDLFTRVGVIVGVSTYLAVFVQLFFAPLLLHRITRRIALTFVILLHLAIAVLMALPWFSLAMIAFDAIFVSTATYIFLDGWLRRRLEPVVDLFWDVVSPIADSIDRWRGRSRSGSRG
jgi:hypothetical protein